MAKTIKELAHQYVYEHCDNDKHAITMQCAYEAGANAVLEKVESLIENTSGDGEVYHYNLYFGLQKLVKELKRE